MIYDYKTLKSLPEDVSLGNIMKFVGKTKNSRQRPGNIDDDCPPIFFWWFEENDGKVNEFIKKAIDEYPWQDEWLLESRENTKWLLYPKRVKEIEICINGVKSDGGIYTRSGAVWLMKNEPEFGRRTNKDLHEFKKFFRSKVEEHLKKKEGIK
jgi:hypothetical protein